VKAENERLVASSADERERADKAIAAFESLAERLEAMAAERAIKPWWKRLLRRAG
jgi:predicted GIY-YIG superfamily endonuclease